MIDLQALKACLLKLPGADSTVSARCDTGITSSHVYSPQLAPHSYTKTVNKNTQRLESLLKVIVTPAVSRSTLSLTSRGPPQLGFRTPQKVSSLITHY